MDIDDKLRVILLKTRKLFMEFGIKNISMDEIARKQGISKKTLYNYVSNKSDLLSKVFDFTLSEVEMYKEELDNDKHNYNAIDILVKISKLITAKIQTSNPSITFELKKYYNEEYTAFLSKKQDFVYKNIIANIEQGINEGLYREDLHKDIVAGLYIKKINDLDCSNNTEDKQYLLTEIFEVMFEMHIRGISTIKGIDYFEKQKEMLKLNFNIK